MKFTLEMKLDNAAFQTDDETVDGMELAQVLVRVADAVHGVTGGGDNAYIYDVNGNRCGSWEVN
jgi:hypothetical protein